MFGRSKKQKEEKPSNPLAEKLALALLKKSSKHRKYKKDVAALINAQNQRMKMLTIALLCMVSKEGGKVVVQKELENSVTEQLETLGLNVEAIPDTPGDTLFRIVDLTAQRKEAEEAAKDARKDAE